ncbi:hypothetical protein HNV12_07875 [Methanococcoides sp. SA1]|nr:hypothetical protein [Methanococcoides sp. SA1]
MIYNLHNIVKFQVNDYRNNFVKKIDSFYDHFLYYIDKDVHEDDLDFVINIGPFTPKNENCHVLDGKYYVKSNYMFCKDSKKLSNWKIELLNIDSSRMVLNLETNFFGNISVLTNFCEFLIHLKMAEKGYPLIHASGISINDKGIVFAARSGGGKTTIVTHLMEYGHKYFGDNFIAVHNGKIYNFLSPLNLFYYNLTPLIKKHLPFKKNASIFVKNIFFKATRGYLKLSTKLNLHEILPDSIDNEVLIDTVFLVIPKKDQSNISFVEIDKELLVSHLKYNQEIEFMHMPFLNYLFSYSYVFPESEISGHFDKYKTSLFDAFPENIKVFKLEVPTRYTKSTIGQIMAVINNDYKTL